MSAMTTASEFLLFISGVCVLILVAMYTAVWISRGNHLAYIGVCVLGVTCLSGYFLVPKPPVYEYHNVRVVKVIDPYTWKLAKDDGEFIAPFCRDYDLTPYDPMPGLVMTKFRYQDLGVCWSVRREDTGFWWKRDSNGIAVKEN